MRNLLSKIDLLQGTDSVHDLSKGNTLPLVARPWGMHHWTLQSGKTPWLFNRGHRRLWGVRLTHQPSPWMRDYGSLTVLPFTGPCLDSLEHQASAYRLEETALFPNFLSARLLRYGVGVQMSPTERGAVFRFSKDDSAEPLRIRLAFDGEFSLAAEPGSSRLHGVSRDAFQGESLRNFGLHFLGETSEPVRAFQRLEDGGYLEFAPGARVVELRLAGSFINHETAALTLRRELLGESLESVRHAGAELWESLLGRVEIGGVPEEQECIFYSCLYRCLLFPRFLNELDEAGRIVHYSPYDGEVHPGPMCADTGFWDGYRTIYPLLALVYPDILERMLEGFLNVCRESGWAPKWPSPGLRDCMIGTHFDAVVADAVVKGITDWEVEEAYEYLWKNASVPSDTGLHGRQGLQDYLQLGYVAADRTRYAASCTLDYAYGDFCISQVAEYLGRAKEAAALRQNALNYRHVFDPAVGFMRGRLSSGEWLGPFREFEWGGAFIEGGPWQHAFSVPHDVAGMAKLYGGPVALCGRLDAMLATPSRFEIGSYPFEIHEMTEMALAPFGQYAHSNQPVHNYLFLYALNGQPAKTAHWVDRVVNELYSIRDFPGDEDNGEMAAWYIWASLGLYPTCPGKAEYVRFPAQVQTASIHTPAGQFTLNADDQALREGQSIISHRELLRGKCCEREILLARTT